MPDELKLELQKLNSSLPQLPDSKKRKKFKEIWASASPQWIQNLRITMFNYCRIGCDWQFNEKQIEILLQYYYANEFLFECMDADCYVSREVRQEIEDTLLLPIAEIEKRKQQ